MATTNTAIRIMQLSEAEFTTLSTQGTLTKDGVTYTYSPNDTIYVTPNSNVTLAQVELLISAAIADVSELIGGAS